MIETFIFFDLETTGFITNNAMPRITEMSLIAVSRNSIISSDSLPRVLHKIILPINPDMSISKKVKLITGLSNENLGEAQSFDCEIYTLVTNFIKRLNGPVCFVAHNGNEFDYPIFLWELQNIDKVLSEDILSIDMLSLVKDLFSQHKGENSRKDLCFKAGKPANFKLSTIYEHIFHKSPENVHSAEGDCVTMLHCAVKFGDLFVEWAQQNAVPLIKHTK